MADASMTLLETLRKVGADGDVDLLRQGVCVLAEAIMEAGVSERTGLAVRADRGSRSASSRPTI